MKVVVFALMAALVAGAVSLDSFAQSPPPGPPDQRGPPEQRDVPKDAQGSPEKMPAMMPRPDMMSMHQNFGQQMAAFVRDAQDQFSQQREQTIDAIKQCRQSIADAAPEDRAAKRQECRENLDDIKNSFRETRDTYRQAFKEFSGDMRVLMNDARQMNVDASKLQQAMSRITDRAMQHMDKDAIINIGQMLERMQNRELPSDASDIASSSWSPDLQITEQDGFLIISSNGIPNHMIGDFPSNFNPNQVQEQDFEFKITQNPEFTGEQLKLPMGPIGIALSGAVFFNPYTATNADAVATEVFDDCGGHPTERGVYHYHQISSCFEDSSEGHSKLFGYAFDGYGIYGPNGKDGVPPTDLDECNGHQESDMSYHYHATKEFPYLLGCYSGYPEPSNFVR